MKKKVLWLILAVFMIPNCVQADQGAFDIDRWYGLIDSVKQNAAQQGISDDIINQTVRGLAFVPSIVKSDKNQSEFKLTLQQYLDRTVSEKRISEGLLMRKKYPTMLSRVDTKYGLPPHVILAFWGLESNYGAVKSKHKLIDAFFTLMYNGRRETFFTNQLMALMKIADKNKLDINDIRGSWAGAMGHFQFIPTTLSQYGVDGNGDGRVDIINSVGDAMFSAGNYLNKLGWNPNERIVRRVVLPADFDLSMLDGKTKLTLPQWAALGVTNPDGSQIPSNQMTAGLVADVAYVQSLRDAATASAQNASTDVDIAPMPVIDAYLTYPNFYRIKKWNNSNWYAIAIAELADKLK
ncbi:MAG: lytic murein transglycosylase [Alphaproteobacteria bacterium]|nr:lytic murein transglycosylase [Alphaproteobacteria bacterium]